MEWKEHVAWFTPISITMVAALFLRYGRVDQQIRTDPRRHEYSVEGKEVMPKASHGASNMTNGAGAVAILSAGIGCFVFAAGGFRGKQADIRQTRTQFLQANWPSFRSEHSWGSRVADRMGVF